MKKYFPILVSKLGEIKALECLTQAAKEEISPVIELTPDMFLDGWTEKKKNAEAAADEKRMKNNLDPIDRTARKQKGYENILLTSLKKHWIFPDNQILLDFTHCGLTLPRYISEFLAVLNSSNINVVPVVSATNSQDIIDLILKFVTENDRPICLRFDSNNFDKISEQTIFDNLVTSYNVNRNRVMILLDGGYIEGHTYEMFKKYTLEALSSLPNTNDWREIIVSFGSFPKDLSDSSLVARKEPHLLKRHEWVIWQDIKKANACGGRVRYSDYGIKHPAYEEIGFPGTASIKYSSENNFVIYKGKKSGETKLGNAQYIMHAKELVTSEYYTNEHFCWGDENIMEYSKKSPEPTPAKKPEGKPKRPESGAAKEWIAFGQNHHLTLMNSLL